MLENGVLIYPNRGFYLLGEPECSDLGAINAATNGVSSRALDTEHG